MSFKLVLNTCPDLASAHSLAEGLLESNLAACVNLIPNVVSLYKWQGQMEQSAEVQLFIKTSERNWPEIQSYISQNHPYDVPEVIALDVSDGLPAYLSWLNDNLKKENL
ncbi:MAG: divalent-cation tolerance protein CutA [Gammaproteobacteria bacterium]|nr:divalent-cation tolerance protein CutA [Gammaproteobacteria bacterium]